MPYLVAKRVHFVRYDIAESAEQRIKRKSKDLLTLFKH